MFQVLNESSIAFSDMGALPPARQLWGFIVPNGVEYNSLMKTGEPTKRVFGFKVRAKFAK